MNAYDYNNPKLTPEGWIKPFTPIKSDVSQIAEFIAHRCPETIGAWGSEIRNAWVNWMVEGQFCTVLKSGQEIQSVSIARPTDDIQACLEDPYYIEWSGDIIYVDLYIGKFRTSLINSNDDAISRHPPRAGTTCIPNTLGSEHGGNTESAHQGIYETGSIRWIKKTWLSAFKHFERLLGRNNFSIAFHRNRTPSKLRLYPADYIYNQLI